MNSRLFWKYSYSTIDNAVLWIHKLWSIQKINLIKFDQIHYFNDGAHGNGKFNICRTKFVKTKVKTARNNHRYVGGGK